MTGGMSTRTALLVGLVLLVLLALAPVDLTSVGVPCPGLRRYGTYILTLWLVTAIAAMGVNLIVGYAGQETLAQAAFVGIGAYLTAIAGKHGVPFGLSFLASGLMTFVIGIAGDYDWTDAEASNSSILFPGFTNHSKVRSLASVTGRVGYAWDRFLGYVKGGGAWEKDDYFYTDGVTTGTASQTRSGWTVGIGGEYAFTNYLTGFAEYDYYDFGNRDALFVDNFGGTFTYGIKETKSVFKVGLNLRWGAGPVVAKY